MNITIARKLGLTHGIFAGIIIFVAAVAWVLDQRSERLSENLVQPLEIYNETSVNLIREINGLEHEVIAYLLDDNRAHLIRIMDIINASSSLRDRHQPPVTAPAAAGQVLQHMSGIGSDLLRLHDGKISLRDAVVSQSRTIENILDNQLAPVISQDSDDAAARFESLLGLKSAAREFLNYFLLPLPIRESHVLEDRINYRGYLDSYRSLPDVTETEIIQLDHADTLFLEMLGSARQLNEVERSQHNQLAALQLQNQTLNRIHANSLLSYRQAMSDDRLQLQRSTRSFSRLVFGAGLLLLVAVLAGFFYLRRTIIHPLRELGQAVDAGAPGKRVMVHAQDEIGQVAEAYNNMCANLEHGVIIETRAMQYTLLRELSSLLQTALTLEEAYPIIADYGERLFPRMSGGMALVVGGKNQVKREAQWGDSEVITPSFHPSDCWAMRRSREHLSTSPEAGQVCDHFTNTASPHRLCVPMVIQGESVGILCLLSDPADSVHTVLAPEIQELAVMVADSIGLPVSNMKLQLALRHQSTHDALTGLYNRRYFTEALSREISRALRYRTNFALFLLDLDYFKKINDDYGHQAGDLVLERTGELLAENIRSSDIACRYGGEEFVLILPQVAPEQIRERAEALVNLFRTQELTYNNHTLKFTCSLGIAVFPDNGDTDEEILHSADQALYLAKSRGRNGYCLLDELNNKH